MGPYGPARPVRVGPCRAVPCWREEERRAGAASAAPLPWRVRPGDRSAAWPRRRRGGSSREESGRPSVHVGKFATLRRSSVLQGRLRNAFSLRFVFRWEQVLAVSCCLLAGLGVALQLQYLESGYGHFFQLLEAQPLRCFSGSFVVT